MDTRPFNEHINRLKTGVTERFGLPLRTSADFVRLSDSICDSGAGYLSQSTLKRLWGYVKDTRAKHLSTLDILARYLGHSDFHSFCREADDEKTESGFSSDATLRVESLGRGALINITWSPDRLLTLRYLGEMTFEVVDGKNTRLSPATRVRCMQFIAGEPLILDIVAECQTGTMAYIVGKNSGIRWSRHDSEPHRN